LTVYRIVQEALSNAAQHAPGASVEVSVNSSDEVRVEVTNGAPQMAPVAARTAALLGAQPDIDVVAQAADGVAAVAAARAERPDVVLMDVRMPKMDGLEAARMIVVDGVAKVLMLTTFDLDEYVYAALRAGASGFLLKDAPRGRARARRARRCRRRGPARTLDHPAADRRLRPPSVPGPRRTAVVVRAHRARDRGARPDRAGTVQSGDRGHALRRRTDHQDARQPHPSPNLVCATGPRPWSWRTSRASSHRGTSAEAAPGTDAAA
jgi:CheY-like chemotaxis protein